MDQKIIILSEVNQKERQIPYDIIYMWNLKNDTNELLNETETDSQREHTCGCHRGKVVGQGEIGDLGLADANYYI